MEIRLIQTGTKEYETMVELRLRVLLHPIGVPSSYINPQKEKDDLLIGAFINGRLAGCCILTLKDAATVQLRQMAVDTALQQKGVGAALVGFAEELAKEKGYRKIMMHARDAVLDFYRKCGYHISGEPFTEVGIGHHPMEKKLDASAP